VLTYDPVPGHNDIWPALHAAVATFAWASMPQSVLTGNHPQPGR
jgi:hypothetical protein